VIENKTKILKMSGGFKMVQAWTKYFNAEDLPGVFD